MWLVLIRCHQSKSRIYRVPSAPIPPNRTSVQVFNVDRFTESNVQLSPQQGNGGGGSRVSGWMSISRIGSFNVMIPIAAAVALALAAEGSWRTLRWWCVSIVGVILITATSKIAFFGWGFGIRSLDFTGFSGHAALAAVVLPGAFVLALRTRSLRLRLSASLFGLIVAACVAVARVKLHAHSAAEAVGGILIGSAASALLVRSLPVAPLAMRRPLMIAGLLALVGTSLMKPAPTQRWMIASALYLSGQDRPFIRQGWRRAPQAWKRPGPVAVNIPLTGGK